VSILETVTENRAELAAKECCPLFDGLTVKHDVEEHRGIITVLQDGRFVVSKEFVETQRSLERPNKLAEYARILQGKARLVVVVPKDLAVEHRLKMLELNRFWLSYYLLYYYDEEGRLFHLDRACWRRLRGLPSDQRWNAEVA